MIGFFKKVFKKLYQVLLVSLPWIISQEEIEKVYDFFCNFDGYRNFKSCSLHCGISEIKCAKIKNILYRKRKLGLYFFEKDVPPQRYMGKFILEKFPEFTVDSKIVEVGPGEFPVFNYKEYKNWLGFDKNYDGHQINFKELKWAKDRYGDKLINGGFENLSVCLATKGLVGQIDMVVASHVYEHTWLPIESLKEAAKVLRSGGVLVLFVPDGFTDDFNTKDLTHTLYLNKPMIQEFFRYAGGFTNLEIKIFRPNADLVITAVKE